MHRVAAWCDVSRVQRSEGTHKAFDHQFASQPSPDGINLCHAHTVAHFEAKPQNPSFAFDVLDTSPSHIAE